MRTAPDAWTAVVNPAAGRGRGDAGLPRLADALAAGGLDLEIELSADAGHLVTLAQDAFARGRGVVACGGDGTVCALAGAECHRHVRKPKARCAHAHLRRRLLP